MADRKMKQVEKPLRPEGAELPQAGPHDTADQTRPAATAGTGMLPKAGQADENDMAPGG